MLESKLKKLPGDDLNFCHQLSEKMPPGIIGDQLRTLLKPLGTIQWRCIRVVPYGLSQKVFRDVEMPLGLGRQITAQFPDGEMLTPLFLFRFFLDCFALQFCARSRQKIIRHRSSQDFNFCRQIDSLSRGQNSEQNNIYAHRKKYFLRNILSETLNQMAFSLAHNKKEN